MTHDSNQTVYADSSIVGYYTQLRRLQPAEQTILARFREQLPQMKVLDIGVGAGRTTGHFAPLAGDYLGIDPSPEMIAACGRRYPEIAFEEGDARAMPQFADSSFDFILFSYNGIDSVSHSDRLKILREICRVGKPGSYAFFSSHNLRSIARAFDYKTHLSLNPLKTYVDLVMWGLLRLVNRGVNVAQIDAAAHLTLKDESHNFRLQNYYIRPEAQIEQLDFGFHQVELYPWKRGVRVELGDPAIEDEMWLYYLCVVSAKGDRGDTQNSSRESKGADA